MLKLIAKMVVNEKFENACEYKMFFIIARNTSSTRIICK
jgi:hypothetical protein